jgi:hypothetical protein
MGRKRLVIGFLIAVSGYFIGAGLSPLLHSYDLEGIAVVAMLGLGILGLVLMVTSGVEGRLFTGVLLTVGALAFVVVIGYLPAPILLAIVLIGVVLITSAILSKRGSSAKPRGEGYQGVIRNLRREESHLTFWLEGAKKDGSSLLVETGMGEGLVNESDRVLVRGSMNEKGVLKATEIENLTRGKSSQSLERRGKGEFSGIVVGELYELEKSARSVISGLRIQRVDASGNPIDMVEAEFKGDKYGGVTIALDRDSVQVKGEWQKSGRFRVSEFTNFTSKTHKKI